MLFSSWNKSVMTVYSSLSSSLSHTGEVSYPYLFPTPLLLSLTLFLFIPHAPLYLLQKIYSYLFTFFYLPLPPTYLYSYFSPIFLTHYFFSQFDYTIPIYSFSFFPTMPVTPELILLNIHS